MAATSGEVAAMDAALQEYAAWLQGIKNASEGVSSWALFGSKDRAAEIYAEARANLDRFVARRNELAASGDHEMILSYVESMRRITGTPLAQAIQTEGENANLATFSENVLSGASADLRGAVSSAFEITLPLVIAGGILFLLLTKKG